MSTERAKPIRLGGVLYSAETPERQALRDFALTLKKRGWNVWGLIQETIRDDDGNKIGLDAIDIRTNIHHPLARPSKEDLESGTCGFDVGWLTEISTLLDDAREDQADLIIVEKFGEREQDGRGFADGIVEAAMAGIPTLVAVPATALERWNDFTGRMGHLLPHDMLNLWNWWPKWNIYRELALGVTDVAPVNIVAGPKTILIEGPHGCGITANPSQQTGVDIPENMTLRDLAIQTHERRDPMTHSLGVAAILAHYNRYDLQGPADSGLDYFEGRNDNILIVGHASSEGASHVTSDQALRHLADYAYDGVIIPSHTFGDGLLPALLQAKGLAETVLVGPETPLCPALFDYGLNVLSGRIIKDPASAAKKVLEGATPQDLKPLSTYVTLTSN